MFLKLQLKILLYYQNFKFYYKGFKGIYGDKQSIYFITLYTMYNYL